jgi:hypothetical protein
LSGNLASFRLIVEEKHNSFHSQGFVTVGLNEGNELFDVETTEAGNETDVVTPVLGDITVVSGSLRADKVRIMGASKHNFTNLQLT